MLATLTIEPTASLNRRQASLAYIRGTAYLYKANWDQSMECLQRGLVLQEQLGNQYEIAKSLRTIGAIHFNRDDYDQAFDHIERALKLFREIGNKYYIAWCLTNIGTFYQYQGKWERVLERLHQGLALFQELGNKRLIAYSLERIGIFYESKGELHQALVNYKQALLIVDETNNKWLIGNCLSSIARIFYSRGELDRALEYHRQVLAIGQEIGNKERIANTRCHIGTINYHQGFLDQAVAELEESFGHYEQMDSKWGMVWTLFWLITVTIEQKALEKAKEYLKRIQQIQELEDSRFISQRYRLAKALILKQSTRIQDKSQAQVLFQEVAEEKMMHHYATQIAMINLCELLLDELKAYGDEDVFHEAKALVHKLYVLAQDQHSFYLAVNALILQAKFALIEGKLTAAAQFLDQAKLTAEENNLGVLTNKAVAEKELLEAQYETWQTLIQSNASFEERLEQSRIVDYLQAIEKAINQQQAEL